MKRRALKWLVIGFVWLGLVACATLPVKPITKAELKDLKGEWIGFRYGSSGGWSYTAETDIKILNDLPILASVTFYGTAVGTVTYSSTGELKDGKLFLQGPYNDCWFELTLHSDGNKMRLEGNYQWRQSRGTVFLEKK